MDSVEARAGKYHHVAWIIPLIKGGLATLAVFAVVMRVFCLHNFSVMDFAGSPGNTYN